MEPFTTEKVPIKVNHYKRLILYANKDDRANMESIIGRAIDCFLDEYEIHLPCSHCGRMMQDGLEADDVVEDCKIDKSKLVRLNKLAESAKVKAYVVIATAVKNYLKKREEATKKLTCVHCGSKEYEVRNRDLNWGDGEIHCAQCGTYIRDFDSG